MAVFAFSGSFDHALDGKGRVIIPSAFREALGDLFTITINPRKTALAIYPQRVWERTLERLSRINPMDEKAVRYERYLMSVSFAGNSVDIQGRVMIPQKLRQKLGLGKDIVFVGLNDCIEIWDAEAYRALEAQTEEEFGDLADYVYEKYTV